MASGSVWGVDIGKSSLKAVRMRRGKEELEIQALAYYEFTPSEDGTVSSAEASRALDELVAQYPAIKKERTLVALPGHASFSRFIKLPAFDPKKLHEMVRFEAQQQIPFPIGEVNWDFSLIQKDYEPDDDREIGLFAIKKDLVYGFIGDLTLCGIEPDVITVAPLAIYNFVRWDTELPEKATVVLDIGWDHTDLVIIDGERYWIRNLALNGYDLTKAISTRLKVPFEEAEKLKRDAAQAKEAKKLYGATELVLKDFVAEIHRSIGFYKAQNKDRTVHIGQILLLGSGSKLPNIRPFFQKELGYPVETVKRLSRLTLDVDVNVDEVELLKEHLPTFAVAFGLGIQGCEDGIAQINLLPEEIQQQKALAKKKPLVAAAVALLFVTVFLAYWAGTNRVKSIDAVLADAQKNLKTYTDGEKARKQEMDVGGTEKKVQELAALTANRSLAVELLNKLAPALPQNGAEIVETTPGQKQILEVDGNKPAKWQAVRKDLELAQDKKNDEKTWILDIELRPTDTGVRASLLAARKFIKNPQNAVDADATLRSIETGLLASLKQVFPSAKFATEQTKQLTALEKDAEYQAPTGITFPARGEVRATPQFLGAKIIIDYPEPAATAAMTPPPSPR